jgi:hypothetical protein
MLTMNKLRYRMFCEHVWTSTNFTKICYRYWLSPSLFKVQQCGNLSSLHHQGRCVHTHRPWWTEGERDVRTHIRVQTHIHIHILCALVQPSTLLQYWSAVIQWDGVINCLHLKMEALHSTETSLTIHQSMRNLHQHHHEKLRSHKIIVDGCISKYREKPYPICNSLL